MSLGRALASKAGLLNLNYKEEKVRGKEVLSEGTAGLRPWGQWLRSWKEFRVPGVQTWRKRRSWARGKGAQLLVTFQPG